MAYADDPRVRRDAGVRGIAFDVQTAAGDRYVCKRNDGWVALSWSGDDDDTGPFDTADEAIRSLIGEPQ